MKRFLLMIVVTSMMWGCYPGGAEFVEDTDAVLTTFDSKFDFASKNKYARPDKIVVDVEIDNGDTTYVYMKDVFAQTIFDAIDENMEELGWTLVDISEEPDLLLNPAAIKSTTYFYSYWYDWWYGGWYGGYWGWYYPPYYTISSYTTGSLIFTLVDPNAGEDSPINQSQASWVAVMNGLYVGTYNVSRVTTAIDDAFEQSPYLKTN
ncbi:MAG TPA: DUF4136 domain-containing protein [Chryseolinea sp.]|nr:DUF4136 domain-containing protein [Flavobacteriales bacterium]HPM32301.1 DUF4136 domain-containing protein [Chryseolinea sp.]